MQLKEVVERLHGIVLTGKYDEKMEVLSGGAADLMSDVLAFNIEGNSLLLSGLTTPQVLRTAEMSGIKAIVFVRGKKPPQQVIELAEELSIHLIMTEKSMYLSCGILHAAGLPDNGVSNLLSR
jgi:hypothetical protein